MDKVNREKLIKIYGFVSAHAMLPEGTMGHMPKWIADDLHGILYPVKTEKKPEARGLSACAQTPIAETFGAKNVTP